MIVSIARELGAGGGTLGDAVATAIDAALLDERWFLEQLTARYQYPSAFVARRLEEPPNLGESLISSLARSTVMSPGASSLTLPDEQIIDAVRTLVLEQARERHVVVIGHGVSMLGWRPAGIEVLAIMLKAGREWRIDQFARRTGLDRAEAERRIKVTDKARVRYQQHYFNANLYDCNLYDLVLNSEVLGLDTVVAIATNAVRTCITNRPAATAPSHGAAAAERT